MIFDMKYLGPQSRLLSRGVKTTEHKQTAFSPVISEKVGRLMPSFSFNAYVTSATEEPRQLDLCHGR